MGRLESTPYAHALHPRDGNAPEDERAGRQANGKEARCVALDQMAGLGESRLGVEDIAEYLDALQAGAKHGKVLKEG
jgi:hypothetical protein